MPKPGQSSAKRVILFDVSRLLARRHFDTPTGIDRVDLRYLDYFLSDPNSTVYGIVLKKKRIRLLGGRSLRKIVSILMQRWNHVLTGETAGKRKMNLLVELAKLEDPFELVRRHVLKTPLPRPFRNLPNAYYVNCSHHGMRDKNRAMFEVLQSFTGCKQIFYVHDMIPLDFPHLVGLGHPERHVERMTIVAENAAMVISNSHYSAERFTAFAQSQGIETPAPVVLSIGVEPSFLNALSEATPPAPSDRPYFVIVGTVEPRKNHKLLLEAWKQLIAAGGEVPQLRIIGRRGWTTEENADYDAVVATLAPHVVETGPVSDAELLSQLLGARALLFPSFTEGWGMPAVEAIVAGVPVVVSDSPGLIEATQGLAPSLSPHDATAWAEIVARLANTADPLHDELTAKLAQFKQPTWDDQFIDLEAALTRNFG